MDAWLLLMALIWGTNYAIVKSAFLEIDPQAFNALRLLLASTVMALASRTAGRLRLDEDFHTSARVTRDEWARLIVLGFVGHGVYQYLFVGGLARTSVANAALIISLTPVVITLVSAVGGHERIGVLHWAGTFLSLAGIYLVVGRAAHLSGASFAGDLMMMAAVVCWTFYTLGARPLMARHSPVGVTALTLIFGTLVYVPVVSPHLAKLPWREISGAAWAKLIYSSVFALCVAYTIWYAAVRRIGSARTAVYSNLLPIIAMLTAYVWLHEPMGRVKLMGAAAVLCGVALTLSARGRQGSSGASVRQS
ncbi:MAG TPA: DMT family transporter [Vicinamibacterales bacterium]|nr:DMT family transporter [Vicinamibacterales bacterium]